MTQMIRNALLFVLLLALVGCSSTTFVYNRLDFIIPWYMGKYVGLDRDQKTFLDDQLQPFLSWHRTEELPAYLLLLDGMEQTLDAEVSQAQVAEIATQFEDAWDRIEWRALEWMLALGEELSREQLEEFTESLREKQVEYEEEYLPRTDEEYRQEAYENLEDSVQDFMGRLDSEQRGYLDQAAQDMRRADNIWLRERAEWLERREVLLQREEGWQQGIRDALATREQTTSAEYLEIFEHNSQVIFRALAQVANVRSDKQDRRLRKKLADFREDIESLIARR
ncbi:MAG: hypothetical protein HOH70_13425 [Halieaceae bacterium]|nr:hypothetical protein [Halieaceae bacterium]